jgi:glutathione S-transferase
MNDIAMRAESKKFIVGDKLSIADFYVLSFVTSYLFNPKFLIAKEIEGVYDKKKFTHFEKYFQNMRKEMKEYLDNRKLCEF